MGSYYTDVAVIRVKARLLVLFPFQPVFSSFWLWFHHAVQLESLLQKIEGEDDSNEDADSSRATDRCRSLERLASEISRLNFYYTKGQVSALQQNFK